MNEYDFERGTSAAKPFLVNADAVAKLLGVHRTTILRLAKRRVIPAFVMGRAIRFDLDEVRQAIHKESFNGTAKKAARNNRSQPGTIRGPGPGGWEAANDRRHRETPSVHPIQILQSGRESWAGIQELFRPSICIILLLITAKSEN